MTEIQKSDDGIVRHPALDLRFNVVSLLNLAALIGLIATAVATWSSMAVKIDGAQEQIKEIRQNFRDTIAQQTNANANLSQQQQINTNRLTSVEVKIESIKGSVDRIEKNVDHIISAKPNQQFPNN